MSQLLGLALALSMFAIVPGSGTGAPPAPDCQRQHRETPITVEECWAWIVQGEVGDDWPEAMSLVAWTLRAWEIKMEMPAGEAGRMWGWYGWQKPSWAAKQAVAAAFGRPLLEAPFQFMQLGSYCYRLGSAADVRKWRATGAWGDPFMMMTHPRWTAYSLNCYLPPRRLWTK